jgi:hypothetical protein
VLDLIPLDFPIFNEVDQHLLIGGVQWYLVAKTKPMGHPLLANGSLVKEGLDLIELPTLVETGIEYRVNDLRQRDRRSWRLIQDQPVRVVFLYSVDPNFANLADMTPLNPPFEGGSSVLPLLRGS